jgi:site-specific DNA-methyltransferase (adenine-specific)
MRIRLQHERCAFIEGDVFKEGLLAALFRDHSFDLICTDPPYGAHTHAKLGAERRSDGAKKRTELAFPPLDQGQVEYLAAQFVRIGRGWIPVFTDDRSVDWWGRGFEKAGGAWIRTGFWFKTNPMPLMRADRPGTGAECIVIGHVTGKDMTWHGGGRSAVWRGPRDREGLHPNQKPAWLMQELVGLFGVTGGSVLDPFLGSASTVVPAFTRERIPGLQPVNLAASKAENEIVLELELAAVGGKRPPIPFGMSVVGIEGDAPTLDTAIERIQPLLKAA